MNEDDVSTSVKASQAGPATKRTRISQACVVCNKRKRRCDGLLPCAPCSLEGRATECSYPPLTKKRGPSKTRQEPTWDHTATSDGNTTSFLDFQNLLQLHTHLPLHSPAIISNAKILYDPQNAVEASLSTESDRDWPLQNLESVLQPVSGGSLVKGVREVLDSKETMVDTYFEQQLVWQELKNENLSADGPGLDVLVPEEILSGLSELFWNYVHSFLPFLCTPLAEQRTKEWLQSQTVLFDACLSMVANMADANYLATRAGEDPGNFPFSVSALDHLFVSKTKYVIFKAHLNPSLEVMQALIMIGFRELGRGRWSQFWQSIGIAYRMAVELDFHRIDSSVYVSHDGQMIDEMEKETRRRSFWLCYMQDKWAAAISGRPPVILSNELEVNLPVPFGDEDSTLWIPSTEQPPEVSIHYQARPKLSVSNFRKLVEIGLILEEILVQFYSVQARKRYRQNIFAVQTLQNISDQLQNWRVAFPESLEWFSGNCYQLPHVYNLHLWYFLAQILLHRTHLPTTTRITYNGRNMPSSHSLCTHAADCIREIVGQYKTNFGLRKATTTPNYATFTAAVIYIGNATSSDAHAARASIKSFNECLGFLQVMAHHSSGAAAHVKILQRLFELTNETRNKAVLVPEANLDQFLSDSTLSNPLSPSLAPFAETNSTPDFWNLLPHSLDPLQYVQILFLLLSTQMTAFKKDGTHLQTVTSKH